MNCEQVSDMLPLYAEGDLEEGDRRSVASHLARCEVCRQRLELDRALGPALCGLLRPRPHFVAPPTLKSRLMAKIERRRRWDPLWRGATLLGRAVAVLVLVAIAAVVATELAGTPPTFLAKITGGTEESRPWQVLSSELVHEPYYWVVDGERVDRVPQLSPDGTKIAYLPTADGQATDVDRIRVREVATGVERDLTPEEGYSYTSIRWSPDGHSLAFVKYSTLGGVAPTEVWRTDANGSDLKLLYRPLPALVGRRGPAFTIVRWSADGKQIQLAPTIWSDGGPNRLISAEGGGEETPIIPAARWFGASEDALVGEIVFSPAGDYALHAVKTAGLQQKPAGAPAGGHSLVRYDLRTQTTTFLGSFPSAIYLSSSDISPDGEWIAVQSAGPLPRSGLPDEPVKLWVVRRDGSGLREVTGLPEDRVLGTLLWANGGRAYLTASPQLWDSRADGRLYELDAEGGEARMIAQETFPAELVSVSRDGRRALVVRGAGERASLHLLALGPAEAVPRPTALPSEDALPSPVAPTPAPAASTAVPLPAADLHVIRMFDAAIGWALGEDGRSVLRTSDGGHTWVDVTPRDLSAVPEFSLVTFGEADFVDRDVAFLLVPNGNGEWSTLWRTYDGGATWETLPTPAPFGRLDFVGRQHGWIAATLGAAAGSSAKEIYRTIDGGASWELVARALPDQQGDNVLPFGGHLRDLSFLDPNTGWAVGVTYAPGHAWLYVTRDGGRTWQAENLPLPAAYADYDVAVGPPRFFSAQEGVLPVHFKGARRTISSYYVTKDGGKTWIAGEPLADVVAFAFADADNGWAVDAWSGNVIYRTRNGGKAWDATMVDAADPAWLRRDFADARTGWLRLDFVDAQTGWALSRPGATAYLLKTSDGGATWDVLRPRLAATGAKEPTPAVHLPAETPSPAPLATCDPEVLRAVGEWSGATGSLAGVLIIGNEGGQTCQVQGRPEVALFDSAGRPLALTVSAFDKTGEPPEPVTLEPGEQAQALLIWSNWCGERTATPVTVRASLPGKGGYVEVAGIGDDRRALTVLPRCDLPEKASHLAVGPFEPRETGE